MPKFSRRDFLKAAAILPPAVALANIFPSSYSLNSGQNSTAPNVIIVLFDAMTARNLSLYGYRRQTTPNFERFAERATVYHAHDSAGNFTIPGTSSLLTGMYPWTHRAINQGGLVDRSLVGQNIFKLFGKEYRRIAFAQNVWADFILTQFKEDIDTFLPPSAFSALHHIFGNSFKDANLAHRAFDDFLFKADSPASLVFGPIEKILLGRSAAQLSAENYPRGLPQNVNYPLYYRLEDVFAGLGSLIKDQASPYVAYFHMFSPHAPYKPNKEFSGKFDDNWRPLNKPAHRFSDRRPNSVLATARRTYDEYVATVDSEFGRFLDGLEQSGHLDNTYVIVTADHGEMFERGEKGHETVLLFDPITHIPLIISAPGQKERKDIYSPTNSVDVLPTLLHLAGREIPERCEGVLLPGLGGKEDIERSTFSVEAKRNPAFAPIKIGTVAMRKGKYKMIYYTGYGQEDLFELYDLENDLEELTDLYSTQPAIAASMREELLASLRAANLKQTPS
jgi:arylsulfatase A-like enzyme